MTTTTANDTAARELRPASGEADGGVAPIQDEAIMSTETIKIRDTSHEEWILEYELEVSFDHHRAVSPRVGYSDGGDPGEPDRFENIVVNRIDGLRLGIRGPLDLSTNKRETLWSPIALTDEASGRVHIAVFGGPKAQGVNLLLEEIEAALAALVPF